MRGRRSSAIDLLGNGPKVIGVLKTENFEFCPQPLSWWIRPLQANRQLSNAHYMVNSLYTLHSSAAWSLLTVFTTLHSRAAQSLLTVCGTRGSVHQCPWHHLTDQWQRWGSQPGRLVQGCKPQFTVWALLMKTGVVSGVPVKSSFLCFRVHMTHLVS